MYFDTYPVVYPSASTVSSCSALFYVLCTTLASIVHSSIETLARKIGDRHQAGIIVISSSGCYCGKKVATIFLHWYWLGVSSSQIKCYKMLYQKIRGRMKHIRYLYKQCYWRPPSNLDPWAQNITPLDRWVPFYFYLPYISLVDGNCA